jgi:glycosyltransferase involved in cell wall biosynthesis
MATHNGEKFITEQLSSILKQLIETDQVIVSDDSSSDHTVELIESFQDERITILRNNTFFNPILNFENALKHASGEIIFLADQDDIWLPDKVATMVKYLEQADVVLSNCQIVDEYGKVLFPSFFALNGSKLGLINNLFKNSYIGCCMAFKRTLLTQALPFPSDLPMHDWWIGLIGEVYGKTLFCDQRLVAYRRHNNNASASGEESHYNLFKKLHFRWIMIKNLLKRRFFHE